MPSALLVHERRGETQLAEPSLGIGIASVESRIDKIYLSAAGGAFRAPGASPFEFDVELSESGRTEGSLSVRYSYAFGRPSCGQVCKISGKAVVRFSQINPERDFHTLGNDISNLMAVEIFRKNYETAYLLHCAMSMDAPSPWITQDVCLSSRNQMIDGAADNP